MSSEVSPAKAADHLRPADPEQSPTAEWGGADGPGLRALRNSAGQEGGAPGRPAQVQPPGFSLDVPLPASLFLSGFPSGDAVSGRRAQPALPLYTLHGRFIQCAWVCRGSDTLQWHLHSSPWVCVPALCLTKPVHCFLFIAQDSGGGRPAWGGGREAGTSLGMDEIMSALFFNFFK